MIGITIPMITVNTTECSAALFANSSFLAPNALAD